MRKLRNWERYVLFPKPKDNPLEGEIPLNIAQKEVKAHKAWMKPVAFIRPVFGKLTLLLRTRSVAASGQRKPFFGNPSTALRVGFDSLPKNSRSAVEQQSKTSRTTLEEESKRYRRSLEQHPKESRTSLEQHPKESRTSLEQQTKKWDKVEELISTPVNVDERRMIFSIDASYRQHDMRSVRAVLSSRFVYSCPKHVLRTRQVCVKYTLSNDIVLKGYTKKAPISTERWPYAMSILYKIAGIFKAIAHRNGTLTVQNPYCANIADRDNTLPGTYQVLPASDRHGFSTASRRLRAPMAIGARSDNDQSAKPEKQNQGRRKVEQKQNTVRTTSGKNAINLRTIYQKATVSIRETYQKYTLDLLKTYQILTKKLLTRYQEVIEELAVLYRNASDNLHAFGSLTVASARRGRLSPSKRSAVSSTFLLCLVVLFSDVQAQSAGERAVEGLNGIKPLHIGDTIPEEFWDLPLPVVNDPDGRDTITLNECRTAPFVLLDFWSRYCGPCIRSLEAFDQMAKSLDLRLPIVSVYVDDPKGLKEYVKDRGWQIPAVVHRESSLLNAYFFNRKQYGGLILIIDGVFYASPGSKDLTAEVFEQLLAGAKLPFETKYPHLLHADNKKEGGL